MKPLKNTTHGAFWLFMSTGARTIIQFIVVIVQTKLLSPADFGLVSASTVVVALLLMISSVGIGFSLVQMKHITEQHIRTGFTLSLAINVLMTIITYGLANQIAGLFHMAELKFVMQAFAAVFIIRSFSIIAESLLQRDLKFKVIAGVEFVSYSTYGVIGILLAYLDFGVWSLIYSYIAQEAVRSLMYLFYCKHSKRLLLNTKAVKELLILSGGFSFAEVNNYLALQSDNFIVGRWLGKEALGLYSRAYQFLVMPATLFGTVLDRVLFPVMSKIQDDHHRLFQIYCRGINFCATFMLPLSVVIIYSSPVIINFAFGDQWDGMIQPFQILAIGMLFRTGYKFSDSLVRSKGAVYKRANVQLIYAICVIAFTWMGQFNYLNGVALGVLVAIIVNYIFMARLSIKLLEETWTRFLKEHLSGIYLSASLTFYILVLDELLGSMHPIAKTSVVVTCSLMATALTFIIIKVKRIQADVGGILSLVIMKKAIRPQARKAGQNG